MGEGARGVFEGLGAVWVSNLKDDTVVRVDPKTFEVVATIPVGDEPKDVVTHGGFVWVVNSKSNTVTRIDPETNRVAGAPIPVGQKPHRPRREQGRPLGDQLPRRHRQPHRPRHLTAKWIRAPSSSTPRSGAAPPRARAGPRLPRPTRPWRSGTPSSAATETLRFHPGDTVLRAGERDRALYLLLDGRLEVEGAGTEIVAPATVGVAGFLDGLPRTVTSSPARTASWRG